jgi:hypothetical protein
MVILGGLGSACGELEVWVPDLSGAATHSFECHRLFVKTSAQVLHLAPRTTP